MKNIPITAFEAYLRLTVAYLPFVVPPFYFNDEGAWLIPLLYFATCFWMLPMVAFTDGREETEAASKVIGRGMLPLAYLMLWGIGLSGVAYLLFGGGRW